MLLLNLHFEYMHAYNLHPTIFKKIIKCVQVNITFFLNTLNILNSPFLFLISFYCHLHLHLLCYDFYKKYYMLKGTIFKRLILIMLLLLIVSTSLCIITGLGGCSVVITCSLFLSLILSFLHHNCYSCDKLTVFNSMSNCFSDYFSYGYHDI